MNESDRGVAGVVLAAGESQRFGGENKLLAPIDGTPIVRRAVDALLETTVDPVLVVIGHEADRVEDALAGRPVTFVCNPAYREGQATSVRAAVQAMPEGVAAAVFALGDMPFVAPSSIEALLVAYHGGEGTALAAAYQGRRGNPVLFDRVHFDTLENLEGDIGGRELLEREGTLVETDDPGVKRDIDRPEELPE